MKLTCIKQFVPFFLKNIIVSEINNTPQNTLATLDFKNVNRSLISFILLENYFEGITKHYSGTELKGHSSWR